MNLFKRAILPAVLAASFMSSAANATYGSGYYVDVLADAGSYSPVVAGDNFQVDACSSTVHHYQKYSGQPWQPSFGICAFSTAALSNFTLIWTAQLGASITTLGTYTGANAINGLTATFATGAGSFFASAGNYIIGLYFEINPSNQNTHLDLPGTYDYGVAGSDYYTGSDRYTHSNGGTANNDYNESSFTVTAAPVPEPAAILLLLPAFAFIARRQRRRRVAISAA
ncbi:MAG: PEP-CTERM sorting domain-containing protein [Kordiimonadaceae bacterium]|nr:PEP-CTERM sorting domain-containing protein [Kordiimonadaceae bacterium]